MSAVVQVVRVLFYNCEVAGLNLWLVLEFFFFYFRAHGWGSVRQSHTIYYFNLFCIIRPVSWISHNYLSHNYLSLLSHFRYRGLRLVLHYRPELTLEDNALSVSAKGTWSHYLLENLFQHNCRSELISLGTRGCVGKSYCVEQIKMAMTEDRTSKR